MVRGSSRVTVQFPWSAGGRDGGHPASLWPPVRRHSKELQPDRSSLSVGGLNAYRVGSRAPGVGVCVPVGGGVAVLVAVGVRVLGGVSVVVGVALVVAVGVVVGVAVEVGADWQKPIWASVVPQKVGALAF